MLRGSVIYAKLYAFFCHFITNFPHSIFSLLFSTYLQFLAMGLVYIFFFFRSFPRSPLIHCILWLTILAMFSQNIFKLLSCTLVYCWFCYRMLVFQRIFDCFYWKFQWVSILYRNEILLMAKNERWEKNNNIVESLFGIHSIYIIKFLSLSLPPLLSFLILVFDGIWLPFIYFKFNPSLWTWKLSWTLEGWTVRMRMRSFFFCNFSVCKSKLWAICHQRPSNE